MKAVQVPVTGGTYALWFYLDQPLQIRAGRLGIVNLPAGELLYIGSAFGPGGLRARLRRHLRTAKRPYWHIDSLTEIVSPRIWAMDTSGRRLECTWVRTLLAQTGARAPVTGFGSSDCRWGCPAHLVALTTLPLARSSLPVVEMKSSAML